MGMKKGALVSSIATIALCASMVVGSTWALFTKETSTNIVVSSAGVNLSAQINDKFMESNAGVVKEIDGRKYVEFHNGGTAEIATNELKLNGITPGDDVTFKINLTNESDIPLTYELRFGYPKLSATSTDDEKKLYALAKTLTIDIRDENQNPMGTTGDILTTETNITMYVTVTFPTTLPQGITTELETIKTINDLQGVNGSELSIVVKATQKHQPTT